MSSRPYGVENAPQRALGLALKIRERKRDLGLGRRRLRRLRTAIRAASSTANNTRLCIVSPGTDGTRRQFVITRTGLPSMKPRMSSTTPAK